MRSLVPIHPQGWFVAGPNPDRYYVPAPSLSYSMGSAAFVHGPLGTPQGSATPAAPKGERRLAFVGDSVCYGFFASGAENLCARVEAGLGAGWRGLNFGVPGYNTRMVAATLRQHALSFEGLAGVVYVFHENDLTNATFASARLHLPARFRQYDLPAPAYKRLLRRSALAVFLRDRLARLGPVPAGAEAAPTPSARPASKPSSYTEALRALMLSPTPHRQAFRGHLAELAQACRERALPFALLYVPLEQSLAADDTSYRDALASLCAEEGVTFLDGDAALRPQREEDLYGDYSHPNGRGHELLAGRVLSWARERLLP